MIRAGRLVVSDLRSVIKRSRFESEPSAVVAQLMSLREKFPNVEFLRTLGHFSRSVSKCLGSGWKRQRRRLKKIYINGDKKQLRVFLDQANLEENVNVIFSHIRELKSTVLAVLYFVNYNTTNIVLFHSHLIPITKICYLSVICKSNNLNIVFQSRKHLLHCDKCSTSQ